MSARKTQVPAIPSVNPSSPAELARFMAATKEALEVGLSRRGDPLDGFVTRRELGDAGVVKVAGGKVIGPGGTGGEGEPGAPIFQPGDPDFGEDDYTVPPAPTGVLARGVGPDSVMVTWDPPRYGNHAYTEVFVILELPAPASSYFDAMLLLSAWDVNKPIGTGNTHNAFAGAAEGSLFMHRDLVRTVNSNLSAIDNALNPTARRYFVRFVSNARVPGPFAPVPDGARGRMTVDPTAVLDALTTAVTNSPVYQRLQAVIHIPAEIRDQVLAQGSLTRVLRTETNSVRQDLTSLGGTVTGLANGIGDLSFLADNETLSEVVQNADGTIDSLWTVRMNTTVGGVRYAAGFGLGLSVDAANGTAQSDFVVAADRFSIVGIRPSNDPTPPLVPFIVDTVRGVVGIRGDLIVDGLVRSQVGDFNQLIAESAFLTHVRAETMRSRLVVANQLIAGITEGEGAGSGGYRIELNAPSVAGPGGSGQYPLRYWNPSTGHDVFAVDRLGNMGLGGNLSVGGNGVIATTGANLTSFGGAGADGAYALWVGPQAAYGQRGEGRTEANALFWVKDNGRAGFKGEFFLGSGALALPSVAAQSSSNPNPGATYNITGSTIRATSNVSSATSVNPITIRADRNGQVAPTLITVSGFLVTFGGTGGGDNKFFRMRAELVGSREPEVPAVAGGLIQEFLQDDFRPECHPFTLTNILQVPAGQYYVRLIVETIDDVTRPMSIQRGWNVWAMQVGA